MTLPASPWELGVEPELKPRPSSCRIQVLTVLSCRLSNRALGFQIINNYNDSDKKTNKKNNQVKCSEGKCFQTEPDDSSGSRAEF